MHADHATTASWSDSLRRTGHHLLGLAETRLELFAVELQEEKQRALSLLVSLVVALALLVAGLLVGLGALALYLWTIAGYFGLLALASVTLAAGGVVLWLIHRRIRTGPTPFSETIGEFRKDRTCLRIDR